MSIFKIRSFLYTLMTAVLFLSPSNQAAELDILTSEDISILSRFPCGTDCNKTCGWDLICRAECFDIVPKCMPKPNPVLDSLWGKYDFYESRLLSEFISQTDGYEYVISRDGNNRAKHQGDSLLWTSIALGTGTCAATEGILDSLIRSIKEREGALVRFEPLPANYFDNATSRDQVTGALFGFAARARRCPQDFDKLKDSWTLVSRYIEKHDALHDGNNGNYRITPGFRFLIRQMDHYFGIGGAPGGVAKATFEGALVANVFAIDITKESCYPVHLTTLNAITADLLGRPIKKRVFSQICRATDGMDLPLTDWYCRRLKGSNLAFYLDDFDNEDISKPQHRYEYRHQRCPAYESPDIRPGDRSPAVDFLILQRLAADSFN
ncbi:MAG: hypothetical protein HRU19_27745 [Pseudobacteriovorax sp.]|nr:hypothetical protein [Pseudobacteriovorax sp.]